MNAIENCKALQENVTLLKARRFELAKQREIIEAQDDGAAIQIAFCLGKLEGVLETKKEYESKPQAIEPAQPVTKPGQ